MPPHPVLEAVGPHWAAEEPKVDIKDIILVGGGLLIAAVIAHGFWIAWRARRDPLRLDLVKDLASDGDDGDDIVRLRAELPNGGARVIGGDQPRQASLELGAGSSQAPMLLDPSERDTDAAPEGERAAASGRQAKTEPRLGAAPRSSVDDSAREAAEADVAATAEDAQADLIADADDGRPEAPPEATPESARAQPSRDRGSERGGVADVIMPERPIRADEPPKETRRWPARRDSATADEPPAAVRGRPGRRPAEQPPQGRAARGAEERPAAGRTQEMRAAEAEQRGAAKDVDELIMLNVLAPKGQPFTGGGMVEALRARGLRYGDMNIFHRVDPMTKATLYSVANVVEPGTFDMADLDNFRSPGVVFFMQLPGPEQPMDTFEDMLKVARDVAVRTGGSLLDENRSVMTGQTVEHYRQRITDYCRRRMSMRA
jgi:cell division protein ZipA